MAILNIFSCQFESIIISLAALGENSGIFLLDFGKKQDDERTART